MMDMKYHISPPSWKDEASGAGTMGAMMIIIMTAQLRVVASVVGAKLEVSLLCRLLAPRRERRNTVQGGFVLERDGSGHFHDTSDASQQPSVGSAALGFPRNRRETDAP